MIKHSKLSFKLRASIVVLILFVEAILFIAFYDNKCDQLLDMQQSEKILYGQNLLYTKAYIDNFLQNYIYHFLLISLLISAIVSIALKSELITIRSF